MRILLLHFLVLFSTSIIAQDRTLLVFVDASSSKSKLALRNKVYSAIQDSEFNLILYISNGKKPLVTTNIYEAQKFIDQIPKLNFEKANYSFDLDSINKILSKDSLASDIKLRSRELNEQLDFYFFFDAKKCREQLQDQSIAQALLLSNRLMYKKGIIKGVNARLYIQNINSVDDSAYFKNIEYSTLFDIVKY
jgi:hypothetical protein